MNPVSVLMRPRWLAFKNAATAGPDKKSNLIRYGLLGMIGAAFWAGLFVISLKVLYYFKGIEDIGDILAYKLLAMVLVTFFSLLVFSGILTVLSKLYMSRDLMLVHSMPVKSRNVFIARWIEAGLDSSWMVLIYALPVLICYGLAYESGLLYYAVMLAGLIPLCIVASGISALIVMAAVLIIPASRIRSIFVFLGLTLFVVLYVAFRLLRPERLVDPDAFETVLFYVQSLKTSGPVYLPSTWAYDLLRAALAGDIGGTLFHFGLSVSFSAFVFCLIVLLADRLYFPGLSKAQTAPSRLLIRKRSGEGRFLSSFSGPLRAIAVKEVKTFMRDQTQWTQIFLVGALIIIYVYNFKVLPLEKSPIETVYLQNLLSFLNMALACFVLIAVTARFAYPAVSQEKEAIWIMRISPVSLESFLWVKFFVYYLPLLFLSETLIIATNMMLDVSPLMMWLSSITMLGVVPGVVAMGVGLGAAYPDFKSENPAQSVTSIGGVSFMILGAAFVGMIIVVQAGPVWRLLMSALRNRHLHWLDWVRIYASFGFCLISCVLAVVLPMRFGAKRLGAHFG